MIIETQQNITLPTQLTPELALEFIKNPHSLFDSLNFLSHLQQEGPKISGIFVAHFPLMGEITLPFTSQILHLPQGAQLIAQPLEGERAWLEILGTGKLQSETTLEHQVILNYHFQFRAHLQLPTSEQWGSRAFEKMVQASAQQSISRVLTALPQALEQAVQDFESKPQ